MEVYAAWIPTALVLLLVVLAVVTSSARQARHRELVARLARLERQNQRIMEHLGLQPERPEYPQVIALLAEGKKIAAIKAYREATGVSLAEAKHAVERMA